MGAVSHDGFEMLEIWLESLWKGQYTCVQNVQSKAVFTLGVFFEAAGVCFTL